MRERRKDSVGGVSDKADLESEFVDPKTSLLGFLDFVIKKTV